DKLVTGVQTCALPIWLSSPGVDGNARVATCYKRHPENDPLAATADRTGRFRDPPINRPEEQLVGTMYESWMLFGQSWVVRNDARSEERRVGKECRSGG